MSGVVWLLLGWAMGPLASVVSLFAWMRWAVPQSSRELDKAEQALDRMSGQCGKSYGLGRKGVYECERPFGHVGKHWTITPPEQLPSTLTRIEKPLHLGLIKMKKGGI